MWGRGREGWIGQGMVGYGRMRQDRVGQGMVGYCRVW